jgi:hypothetical protein
MVRTPKILASTLVLGLFLAACARPDKEDMVPIGPDVRASMVIYYNVGVSEDQINHFLQNVIGRPDTQGKGHYMREGIGMSLRVYPPLEDREATAVTFSGRVTQAQRDEIKRDVISSPIVYKVLENVAPADVKTLD